MTRNQRERLMGATVAVVAEHGYESTRVADILKVAGVSRSAFYKHFANKHECFLATLDAMLEATTPVLARVYEQSGGSWETRLRAVFLRIVDLIVAQPAAARMWFIEIHAAGPDAVERVERLGDQLERLVTEAIAETPERRDMPPYLVRAILGGLRQIAYTRLRHGRQEELYELAPDLISWALAYRSPPRPLTDPGPRPKLRPPATTLPEPRDRIVAAVTELVAEKGYPALTTTEIAQRAAISLRTLYAHYETKGDVFLAAIEEGERRLAEAVLPAYRAAPDWPHAVKDGLYAFFAFLASDTATARLGGLDIYAAGPRALDRHETANQRFQALLARGYQEHPETSPVVSEAIGCSISALLFQHLRRVGAERIYEAAPTAVFLALAPFVGSRLAGEIAVEPRPSTANG